MPIYEYKCQDCGRLTSVFVKSMTSESRHHLPSLRRQQALPRHLRLRLPQVRGDHPRRSTAPSPSASKTTATRARSAAGSSESSSEMGEELPEPTRKMIDAAREGELPPPLTD